MHILHTEASCGWGGQEIRILEESRGLISHGHNVKVLCPHESRIFEEAPKYGVPSIALPIGKKNLKGLFALRSWLKKHKVDVINTHSSTDTWLAALACKTINNSPPIVRTRHISSPIPDNRASRWLYTNAVVHVVTTGEALRRQVIEQTGASSSNVTSIPTGIDPDRFRPRDKKQTRIALGLNPNTNYIGIVATLRSWKGHLYLLDAFAQIKGANWELVIIGDGPMQGPISEKINELGLKEKIHMVGQQNNPEEWMAALDIFCLPSYANEGVPQAILQAMFTGLPIITTPVGAIEEAVQDGKSALIVEPQDSNTLKTAIQSFINHTDLGEKLGDFAQKTALSLYTKKNMLNDMQRIFNQATNVRQ